MGQSKYRIFELSARAVMPRRKTGSGTLPLTVRRRKSASGFPPFMSRTATRCSFRSCVSCREMTFPSRQTTGPSKDYPM